MAQDMTRSGELRYMGVRPSTPPNLLSKKINPLPTYNKYDIGTLWVNTVTNGIWMLTNLNAGVATWTPLDAGAALQVNAENATSINGVDFSNDDAHIVLGVSGESGVTIRIYSTGL